MARNRILAIIQAGGSGGRMDVLVRERAKPALPFAGVYQLLDFPLSNLAHSGVDDVWLAVQYQGSSLEEQVSNGRPWDLDRTRGGLRLLAPEQGTGSADEEGFARGNADGLFRIRDQVRSFGPVAVLVLSADHVYRFDYLDAVASHRERGAECTVVTSEVALEQAGSHATVEHDDDGRVTAFAYKPEEPATTVVATEVFVYEPAVLLEVLEELHRELGGEAEGGDSGLGDFGHHLLPRLVERGRTFAHPMPGYWRDLGQPHLYVAAHQDLLAGDTGLFAEDWPVLSQQPQRPPAMLEAGATVEDSLVSPGSRVAGTVHRSVLGPGVVVEAGAEVRHSVVFADVVVRRGARVDWAVVDTRCEIGPSASVGAADAEATRRPDHVTMLGRDSVVGEGVQLGRGARLEPGTTA